MRTESLPNSGSNRHYSRVFLDDGRTLIKVESDDVAENRTFVYLARHFASKGLPVPEIFEMDEDGKTYTQSDLGTVSLYDRLAEGRKSHYSEEDARLLEKTMRLLPHVQVEGARDLDWQKCLSPQCFDERSVLYDLNYFKYLFLKVSDVKFDENALQDDMEKMTHDLLDCAKKYEGFLYRDFQARNVMLVDGNPYLIDFQGGRRGPLHYDVASFVMQASSHYPEDLKSRLVDAYLDELQKITDVDVAEFKSQLQLFYLFRTFQVLGAYGLRGKVEGKPYFLNSIPAALQNLQYLSSQGALDRYPELLRIQESLTHNP